MNMNYGKITDGKIEYAPNTVCVGGALILAPRAEHYASCGYLPVAHNAPDEREGMTARLTGYEAVDGRICAVYDYEPNTPAPVYISKSKVEAVIDEMGKTAQFVAWLNSRAAYFGAWMRGGDEIEYDPTAHGGDLASLIAAIGIAADGVPALIEKVVA